MAYNKFQRVRTHGKTMMQALCCQEPKLPRVMETCVSVLEKHGVFDIP